MQEVVAAVDVGGTRIKAALVDRSYDVVAALTVPTPADIGADIGSTLASAVGGLLATAERDGAPSRLVGCGVVVPGLVDERRGVGLWSANLGWRDLPVRDAVAARLQVGTVVGHDVRAGLLAETRLGAARGARHALFLPVGTGIAGALLLEGVLVSGDGWAGELGHMVIDPAGPPCACGAVGCLETIASAAAVERAYAAQTGELAPGRAGRRARGRRRPRGQPGVGPRRVGAGCGDRRHGDPDRGGPRAPRRGARRER